MTFLPLRMVERQNGKAIHTYTAPRHHLDEENDVVQILLLAQEWRMGLPRRRFCQVQHFAAFLHQTYKNRKFHDVLECYVLPHWAHCNKNKTPVSVLVRHQWDFLH